eukprot:1196309-Prorocentrum_minimum.AAC.3
MNNPLLGGSASPAPVTAGVHTTLRRPIPPKTHISVGHDLHPVPAPVQRPAPPARRPAWRAPARPRPAWRASDWSPPAPPGGSAPPAPPVAGNVTRN